MKTLILLLLLSSTAQAHDWCNNHSDGDGSITVCGVSSDTVEEALLAATREFEVICRASSLCPQAKHDVEVRRNECNDGHCYQLITVHLSGHLTRQQQYAQEDAIKAAAREVKIARYKAAVLRAKIKYEKALAKSEAADAAFFKEWHAHPSWSKPYPDEARMPTMDTVYAPDLYPEYHQ